MALASHPPVPTLTFAVEHPVNSVALSIKPAINSIASFVQFPINSVTLTFHLLGQPVLSCFPGHICVSVETSFNPVSFTIQHSVDLVAFSI
jgi:hypothetical protein